MSELERSKLPDPTHSHRWTIYLRSGNGKDISWLFEKVTITLHESFVNHKRTFVQPPYEATETGWGEFDVLIRMAFCDATEKPITVMHHLRLFALPQAPPSEDTEVVSEKYDELVFLDPTETMYQAYLDNHKKDIEVNYKTTFSKTLEQKELALLLQALNKIKDESNSYKTKIEELQLKISGIKDAEKLAEEAVLITLPKDSDLSETNGVSSEESDDGSFSDAIESVASGTVKKRQKTPGDDDTAPRKRVKKLTGNGPKR